MIYGCSEFPINQFGIELFIFEYVFNVLTDI